MFKMSNILMEQCADNTIEKYKELQFEETIQ